MKWNYKKPDNLRLYCLWNKKKLWNINLSPFLYLKNIVLDILLIQNWTEIYRPIKNVI